MIVFNYNMIRSEMLEAFSVIDEKHCCIQDVLVQVRAKFFVSMDIL